MWPVRIDEEKDKEPGDCVRTTRVLCGKVRALSVGVKQEKVVDTWERALDGARKGCLRFNGIIVNAPGKRAILTIAL